MMPDPTLDLPTGPATPMTAADLLARLRRHYIKPGDLPGGVFIPECGLNGTHKQRRADALYVGFTSTSGRRLIGHEIKVSRADWRKELDSAGKADFWADNCHAWYIVAPGPDVVPPEEIPDGWGLMYPNPRTKTRMQIVVKARIDADRRPSWLAVRSIMARLDTLRAGHDADVKQKALDDARRQAAAEYEARARSDSRTPLTPEQRARLEVLDRLEELLGKRVARYVFSIDTLRDVAVEDLAAALRLVQSAKRLGLVARQEYAIGHLRDVANQLLSGLEEFGKARDVVLALTEGRDRG